MNIQDYVNLVTSEYAEKPNFIEMLSQDVSILVRIQDLMQSMIPLFDIDVASGSQLDIIGLWVGVSRNVSIPIAGVYFTWDGADPTVGWDYGTWQPYNQPVNITVLPDDAYLTLIRAKIAANHWDGTIEGAYAIWEDVFPQYNILIKDNQDMSYDLGIVGGIVDSLTIALLTGGYIPLKPEGVRVAGYFVAPGSDQLFAWDSETALLAGWEEGSWVQEYLPT